MKLEVFSDMSERLHYNLPGFPLYAGRRELHFFDRYAVDCHWHPDLEFILIQNGTMDFYVNGQTIQLKAGEGVFVNSKRLHYSYSNNYSDCSFLVVVAHPAMLGGETYVGHNYFESKFGSQNEDYILLTNDNSWKSDMLKSIRLIYEEMHSDDWNPLRLMSQITSLCAKTGDHIQPVLYSHLDESAWMAVYNMIGFIQKNYEKKITLDDIAVAGSVCRSKGCKTFREYVGKTPIAYLTQYRINKSCEMLKESNGSVLEIAIACGFQSPSYFSQVFQKASGMTPREYRITSISNTTKRFHDGSIVPSYPVDAHSLFASGQRLQR